MFTSPVRRSGSLRSVWHRRERKRRPLDPRPDTHPIEPRPTGRRRQQPTEAEWLCGIPDTMLRCLVRLTTDRGIVFHLPRHAVQRKLRLFYCGCCRLHWDALPPRGRDTAEVVERYTDGRADAKQLRTARRVAESVVRTAYPLWAEGGNPPGAWDASNAARLVVVAAEVHARLRSGHVPRGSPASDPDQAALLRDLFGNPFRPVEIARTWRTRTVLDLARVIHTHRAHELMSVLGDALQDAGCASEEVLGHCYVPGPHTTGCWLVDGLLGRG